jgi:hypothetical protein
VSKKKILAELIDSNIQCLRDEIEQYEKAAAEHDKAIEEIEGKRADCEAAIFEREESISLLQFFRRGAE